MADLLLVGRVDVVDVADVDGRRQADLGIGGGHPALDVAHARPAGLDRLGLARTEVGQLHHQERQVRPLERATPVGDQGRQQAGIGRRLGDIGLALVPGKTLQAIGDQRRDHAVAQGRQAAGPHPGRRGRQAALGDGRRDLVAPSRAQRDERPVVDLKPLLGGRPPGPAAAARVDGPHRDQVGTDLQPTARDLVVTRLVPALRRADLAAVDEGGVQIVDRSQRQGRALPGLLGGQGDRGAQPDRAVESFQA